MGGTTAPDVACICEQTTPPECRICLKRVFRLWNTQIIDTCVIFQSWHIRTQFGFFLSFIAIVLLGILFERLRKAQRLLDIKISSSLVEKRRESAESQLLLTTGPKQCASLPHNRWQPQSTLLTTFCVNPDMLFLPSVGLSAPHCTAYPPSSRSS